MQQKSIVPVILSGGAGTRLWPLSRPQKPKQFLVLGLGATLFAKALRRCSGIGLDERPVIVASAQHKTLVRDQLRAEGREAELVLEPLRRDSCAAVIAGTLAVQSRDPDSLVLAIASDHLIPDDEAFRAAVRDAVPAAEAGWIVAFGVPPKGPATGFGYILASHEKAGGSAFRVEAFREKPDAATAAEYVKQGFLWNSGNLLFRARDFLQEAETHAPGVMAAVTEAFRSGARGHSSIHLAENPFSSSPRISVDHAILERTRRSAVTLAPYDWSDIGTWEALAAAMPPQSAAEGHGNASLAASDNVFVWSDGPRVAVVGCHNLIVSATREAVLVAAMGSSDLVKAAIAKTETAKAGTGPETASVEVLAAHWDVQLRRITVAEAGCYVEPPHHSPYWLHVQRGSVRVFNGKDVIIAVPSKPVWVESGKTLRIENAGSGEAVILHLQLIPGSGDD